MRNEQAPPIALPAAIVVIAALVRLRLLGEIPLDYDEVVTHIVSQMPLAQLREALAETHHVPPLSYLLLRLADSVGLEQGWLRLPSALLGAATCGLLYSLGRRMLGVREAAVASLFLALSPFHVQHSQMARSYALLGFLVVCAALGLWRALEDDRRRDWLLAGTSAVLALYTHYFAGFALLALGILAACESRRMRREGRGQRALATAGACAVLVAPALLLAGARAGASYVPFDVFEWGDLGLPFALSTLRTSFRGAAAAAFIHDMAGRSAWLFFDPVSLVAAALALYGALQLRTQHEDRRVLAWLGLLVALPLLGAVGGVAGRSFFAHRYAIGALPFYLLLVALGACAAHRALCREFELASRGRAALAGLGAAIALVFLLGLDQRAPSRLGLWPSQSSRLELAQRFEGVWPRAAEQLVADGFRAGDGLLVAEAPGAASAGDDLAPALLRWQAHNAALLHYHVAQQTGLGLGLQSFIASSGFAESPAGKAVLGSLIPGGGGAWRVWRGAGPPRVWLVGFGLGLGPRGEPRGYATMQRAVIETGRETPVERRLESRLLVREPGTE